jgi:hypothetical protein
MIMMLYPWFKVCYGGTPIEVAAAERINQRIHEVVIEKQLLRRKQNDASVLSHFVRIDQLCLHFQMSSVWNIVDQLKESVGNYVPPTIQTSSAQVNPSQPSLYAPSGSQNAAVTSPTASAAAPVANQGTTLNFSSPSTAATPLKSNQPIVLKLGGGGSSYQSFDDEEEDFNQHQQQPPMQYAQMPMWQMQQLQQQQLMQQQLLMQQQAALQAQHNLRMGFGFHPAGFQQPQQANNQPRVAMMMMQPGIQMNAAALNMFAGGGMFAAASPNNKTKK